MLEVIEIHVISLSLSPFLCLMLFRIFILLRRDTEYQKDKNTCLFTPVQGL